MKRTHGLAPSLKGWPYLLLISVAALLFTEQSAPGSQVRPAASPSQSSGVPRHSGTVWQNHTEDISGIWTSVSALVQNDKTRLDVGWHLSNPANLDCKSGLDFSRFSVNAARKNVVLLLCIDENKNSDLGHRPYPTALPFHPRPSGPRDGASDPQPVELHYLCTLRRSPSLSLPPSPRSLASTRHEALSLSRSLSCFLSASLSLSSRTAEEGHDRSRSSSPPARLSLRKAGREAEKTMQDSARLLLITNNCQRGC